MSLRGDRAAINEAIPLPLSEIAASSCGLLAMTDQQDVIARRPNGERLTKQSLLYSSGILFYGIKL